MSPQAKCLRASNEVIDRTVISLDLKNPKKQSKAAAHSIITFASDLWGVQCSFSCNRITGVIGSHTLVSVCCVLWILDCTSRSCGIEENSLGSGRPKVTCICVIANKYTFIVCGDSFWDAKWVEK